MMIRRISLRSQIITSHQTSQADGAAKGKPDEIFEIINKPNPEEAGKMTAIALDRPFGLLRVLRLVVVPYIAGREGIVLLAPKPSSFFDLALASLGQ